MKWCTQNCHYHLRKPWVLQVHYHINGWFPSTTCQAKTHYKRSNCIGIKEWCIDDGIIAPGTASQAIEEQHYYRGMHLHKECFDISFQFRFEKMKS